MKKTLVLLLALVMLATMVVGVSAESGNVAGTITVTNPYDGATYTAYKILDLETYVEGAAYAYKVADGWADFVTEANGFAIDSNGYVTAATSFDAKEVAKAAVAFAEEKGIDGVTGAIVDGEYVINVDVLGYYAVDTSLGALCALGTPDTNVDITEKNDIPSIEKKVEDDNGAWVDTTDAEIGQNVKFKATITNGTGTDSLKMIDTMSNGLTFKNDVVVKIGNDVVDAANYTVATEAGSTFTVTFTEEYVLSLEANTELDVYYSADVNKSAVVAPDANPNEVTLKYGDDYTFETDPYEVEVYTYDLGIYKYEMKKGQETALTGAKFELYYDEKCTNPVKWDASYKVDKTGSATIDMSNASEITLTGLEAGTYYLKETKAPEGYNLLQEVKTVTIADDEASYTKVITKVENKTGTELPETGGAGTVAFTVVGSLLMLAAVVLFTAKKKMSVQG